MRLLTLERVSSASNARNTQNTQKQRASTQLGAQVNSARVASINKYTLRCTPRHAAMHIRSSAQALLGAASGCAAGWGADDTARKCQRAAADATQTQRTRTVRLLFTESASDSSRLSQNKLYPEAVRATT